MKIRKIYFGMLAISFVLSGCMKDDNDIGGALTPLEQFDKYNMHYPYRVQSVLGNKWFRFDRVVCPDNAVADSLTRLQVLDSMFLTCISRPSNRIETTYRMATVVTHDENNGNTSRLEYHYWGPESDAFGFFSDFKFPVIQGNGKYEPEVFSASSYTITSGGFIHLKKAYKTPADTIGHYVIIFVRAY